jgi:cytidylate kinase
MDVVEAFLRAHSYIYESKPTNASLYNRLIYLNIVISGLTAAGKTTHALLLAEALGYKCVSATEILADLCHIPYDKSGQFWIEHGAAIECVREGDEIDHELDRRMIELAETKDQQVFDAWALPWISKAQMIRIWLESDSQSRKWKCFVSQGPNPRLTLDECEKLIWEKDSRARNRFRRLHSFDLFYNRAIFDVVLDNSRFIEAPTYSSARKGIQQFHPILMASVKTLMNLSS